MGSRAGEDNPGLTLRWYLSDSEMTVPYWSLIGYEVSVNTGTHHDAAVIRRSISPDQKY